MICTGRWRHSVPSIERKARGIGSPSIIQNQIVNKLEHLKLDSLRTARVRLHLYILRNKCNLYDIAAAHRLFQLFYKAPLI